MDSQQIFQLIDSILPFEVCLYYEVLPLSIHGSRLHLGMVDTKDVSALDYVRRILGYVNCSLVPKSLESQVHSDTLSAYLKYSNSRNTQLSTSPGKKRSHSTRDRKSDPPVNKNDEPSLVYNPAGNLIRNDRQIEVSQCGLGVSPSGATGESFRVCLLYTSDAADD